MYSIGFRVRRASIHLLDYVRLPERWVVQHHQDWTRVMRYFLPAAS